MFFLSSCISICFAPCLLVASGRLLAWDPCPPGCFTMHFLIVGTTSTFSCTKPLSFSCSDMPLRHFFSPPPPPATFAVLYIGTVTLSLYESAFAALIANVFRQFWVQEHSCKFRVAQCQLYFPAVTKCICCWNASLSSLWSPFSYLTAFSDITGIQRWEVFSLESGPYA